MVNFIEVHSSGKAFLVNVDHIRTIVPKEDGRTSIHLLDHTYVVDECYLDIAEKLGKLNQVSIPITLGKESINVSVPMSMSELVFGSRIGR